TLRGSFPISAGLGFYAAGFGRLLCPFPAGRARGGAQTSIGRQVIVYPGVGRDARLGVVRGGTFLRQRTTAAGLDCDGSVLGRAPLHLCRTESTALDHDAANRGEWFFPARRLSELR